MRTTGKKYVSTINKLFDYNIIDNGFGKLWEVEEEDDPTPYFSATERHTKPRFSR